MTDGAVIETANIPDPTSSKKFAFGPPSSVCGVRMRWWNGVWKMDWDWRTLVVMELTEGWRNLVLQAWWLMLSEMSDLLLLIWNESHVEVEWRQMRSSWFEFTLRWPNPTWRSSRNIGQLNREVQGCSCSCCNSSSSSLCAEQLLSQINESVSCCMS